LCYCRYDVNSALTLRQADMNATRPRRGAEPPPVIVVGSGLAGLWVALRAARCGPVLLVTKAALTDGSSTWAQGGIAAAVAPDDSAEDHLADTLTAGAGLCDPAAAEALCLEAAARLRDLVA